jgi:hypothetical protein
MERARLGTRDSGTAPCAPLPRARSRAPGGAAEQGGDPPPRAAATCMSPVSPVTARPQWEQQRRHPRQRLAAPARPTGRDPLPTAPAADRARSAATDRAAPARRARAAVRARASAPRPALGPVARPGARRSADPAASTPRATSRAQAPASVPCGQPGGPRHHSRSAQRVRVALERVRRRARPGPARVHPAPAQHRSLFACSTGAFCRHGQDAAACCRGDRRSDRLLELALIDTRSSIRRASRRARARDRPRDRSARRPGTPPSPRTTAAASGHARLSAWTTGSVSTTSPSDDRRSTAILRKPPGGTERAHRHQPANCIW